MAQSRPRNERADRPTTPHQQGEPRHRGGSENQQQQHSNSRRTTRDRRDSTNSRGGGGRGGSSSGGRFAGGGGGRGGKRGGNSSNNDSFRTGSSEGRKREHDDYSADTSGFAETPRSDNHNPLRKGQFGAKAGYHHQSPSQQQSQLQHQRRLGSSVNISRRERGSSRTNNNSGHHHHQQQQTRHSAGNATTTTGAAPSTPDHRNRHSSRASPPTSAGNSPAEQHQGTPKHRPRRGTEPRSPGGPSPSHPGRWQQMREKRNSKGAGKRKASSFAKRLRPQTHSIAVGTDNEEGWERHAPKPRYEEDREEITAGKSKTTRVNQRAITGNSCTPPAQQLQHDVSSDTDDEHVSHRTSNDSSNSTQQQQQQQQHVGRLHLCQDVHWTDGQCTTLRTLRDLLADDSPVVMEADTPVIGPKSGGGGGGSAGDSTEGRFSAPLPATAMTVDSVATPKTFRILHSSQQQQFGQADTLGGGGSTSFGGGRSPSQSFGFPSGTLPDAATSPSMNPQQALPPSSVAVLPQSVGNDTRDRIDLFDFLMQDYCPTENKFGWSQSEDGKKTVFQAVTDLVERMIPVLRKKPLLRRAKTPSYILGDIHGNFQDLHFFIKSILTFGDIRLTTSHILCLGDYVDRGEHSLECFILLLALTAIDPDKITLLRGNHEDRVVCGDKGNYGNMCFYGQCESIFGPEDGRRMFATVTRVFQHLPLAMILDTHSGGGRALCTHGGFPRFNCNPRDDDQLQFLASKDFPRFLTLFPNNPLSDMSDVEDRKTELQWTAPGASELPEERHQRAWFSTFDMMWSDPTLEDDGAGVDSWGFGRSTRGQAVVCFTSQAVESFLTAHNCNMLFRAHQEKAHGIRLSKSSKVLTIFSSSNYLGHGNGAGCAVINGAGEVRLVVKSGEDGMLLQTTSD